VDREADRGVGIHTILVGRHVMATTAKVVFVCLHGAAKSVLAAALFGQEAARARVPVETLARGIEPDEEVSAAAAAGLLTEGLDVRGDRPRALTRGDLVGASRVITFGCDVSKMVPPGVPVEQWAEVPAVSDGYAGARAAVVSHFPSLLEACRRS
jgi:arsenate reductase (thioredoxin)